MTLRFHNTLTGKTDEFVPQIEGSVSLYTCGPTVYNHLHVGNWASYIYWDTLIRVLEANNYNVTRVMNITDVGHLTSDSDEGEDKLEKGARREGKTAWQIAEFYTNDFLEGMKSLGLVEPQYIAKATDFIPQQFELLRKLKDKGFTYQIDDGIYFDTSKFPTYANFAHLNLDELKAGARIGYNPGKRNASDFALWKFTPVGEKRDMEWQTPIDLLDNSRAADVTTMNGPLEPKSDSVEKIMGFPGWHLECSAIALSLLGNTIDIHTGGIDHIPVHHTNEIAQSEAATGVRFSNYWLHNNHIKVNGTKISKSLDNGYTLQDLAAKGFSPLDFRMYILQGHYRSEGNFTFESLVAAKNRLNNWRNMAAIRHQVHDTLKGDKEIRESDNAFSPYATSQAVVEAVSNDLGTPEALLIIDQAFTGTAETKLSDINRDAFVVLLETIDSILGLDLIKSTPDISDEQKQLILERKQARKNMDWNTSDRLRSDLEKQDIIISDTEHDDTIWGYKDK